MIYIRALFEFTQYLTGKLSLWIMSQIFLFIVPYLILVYQILLWLINYFLSKNWCFWYVTYICWVKFFKYSFLDLYFRSSHAWTWVIILIIIYGSNLFSIVQIVNIRLVFFSFIFSQLKYVFLKVHSKLKSTILRQRAFLLPSQEIWWVFFSSLFTFFIHMIC